MIQELIKNKTVDGEVTPCEKILGDRSRVFRVADFWDMNADLVELIAVNGLLDYAQTETFTSEEYAMFRKGIAYIGQFMAECSKERISLTKSET